MRRFTGQGGWFAPFIIETPVLSTFPERCGVFRLFCDPYGNDAGTSMAAPQVTGLAALVLSAHPGFTAEQVKQCIVDGAESNGALVPGMDFHIVHAPAAIQCAPETVVVTDDQWKTLELSWAGGSTNPEPANWQQSGFDDSGMVRRIHSRRPTPSVGGHSRR